jgi:hypothetical protein
MECCSEVLSPHEQRVRDEIRGIAVTSGRERVYRVLDSFRSARPVIGMERARYFTESFRQTEGQPLVLRWAKALPGERRRLDIRAARILNRQRSRHRSRRNPREGRSHSVRGGFKLRPLSEGAERPRV